MDIVSRIILGCILYAIFTAPIHWYASTSNRPKAFEKNHLLSNWYDQRFSAIGSAWCSPFIHDILETYFPSKKMFYFVSPAYNKAVYEKIMYNSICNVTVASFTCSDICKLKGCEETQSNGLSSFTYLPEKSAFNLNSYIHVPVDLIFDMKGALWYSKKGKELSRLLEIYYSALQPNGLLVIDTGNVSFKEIMLSECKHIFHKKTIRLEESTLQILLHKKQFVTYMDIHFMRLPDLSYITKDGNELAFALYKKL